MVAVALTVLHVVVCVFLIIAVILQSGRGADIAAAFGGMGSQTAFGPRGSATILTKATTWAAVIFMLTSITLSVMATRKTTTGSVLGNTPAQTQPATPPAKPAPPPANPK